MRNNIFAAVLLVGGIGSAAFGSTVQITSFEDPSEGGAAYSNGSTYPTGFELASGASSGNTYIATEGSVSGNSNSVPAEDGTQYLLFNFNGGPGGIMNDPTNTTMNGLLGTYTPGTTFTLSYYVAKMPLNTAGTAVVTLFDGSTALVPTSQSLIASADETSTFQESTQTYAAPSDADGAQLNLEIAEAGSSTDGNSDQVGVDNVQLSTIAPTPEPASMVAIGVAGCLGLLHRRRQNRR